MANESESNFYIRDYFLIIRKLWRFEKLGVLNNSLTDSYFFIGSVPLLELPEFDLRSQIEVKKRKSILTGLAGVGVINIFSWI